MQKQQFYDQNWTHDWVGEWYSIFRSLGEHTDMIFLKCSLAGEIEDAYYMDHGANDGAGALKILTEKAQTPAMSYDLNKAVRPNFFKQLLGFLRYFLDTRVHSINWKTRHHEMAGKKMQPLVHVMSVEQTKNLLAKARTEGVSLTMYILKYVDSGVREFLQNEQKENIWLVPVDMRASFKRKNPLSNHYSYVAVRPSANMSLAALNRQFKTSLAIGYHFAAWWGLLVGRIIGLKGMQKITAKYHKKKHSWTGVLSNMGRWGHPGSKHVWAVTSPVTRTHPVGVVFMTWNGQFSISMQVHPSVDPDGSLSQRLLDFLRKNL